MKKCLLLIAALSLAGASFAQDAPEIRKGYIGITLGPAFPLGDIDSDAVSGGAQISIVNFGYLFSDHAGLAAKWFGNAFRSKYDDDTSIGLGGLMVGPLLTTYNANRIVEFDVIPMIGFGSGTLINNNNTTSSSRCFVFGISGAARWNCGKRISVSLGLDYINGKPDKVDLSTVGIMLGVNYRLK